MTGEITALQSEFDSGGTFTVLRGYDAAHRLFRGRRTEAYTADDRLRHRPEGGAASRAPHRRRHQHDHGLRARLPGRHQRLGPAAAAGSGRRASRSPSARGSSASARPPRRPVPPQPAAPRTRTRSCCKLGADLLRFRAVVTSSEQVKEVEVRGWDTATKQALTATKPAVTTSVVLPDTDPAKLAKTFGDARYVSTDVPHRTQAEVDVAAAALAEAVAGVFAEFEGVARGQPGGARRRGDHHGRPRLAVRREVHRHHVAPPARPDHRLHDVVLGDRRPGPHACSGLASGGGPATTAPPGVVVAVVDDVNDPEKTGRVRLRFPWLDDTYVSGWARTVQAGAGKDRGALVLPEVGDEVLVVFEQGDVRRPYVLGGLYNGMDQPEPAGHPRRRRRQGRGQPTLVRLPPGPPDRPPRRGRQDRGHHRRQRRRQGQPEAGRDRHQGDRALRRHRADRGHPGHHGRLGQRQARAQGRPDLAHGHPGRAPSTAAAVR